MAIWSAKLLNQNTPVTAASNEIDVGNYDGASFHIVWDGALTASFTLQTSNDGTNWFNESTTISGAAGYASNVMVHAGNLQSRYARIYSLVATPAGTLVITGQAKQ